MGEHSKRRTVAQNGLKPFVSKKRPHRLEIWVAETVAGHSKWMPMICKQKAQPTRKLDHFSPIKACLHHQWCLLPCLCTFQVVIFLVVGLPAAILGLYSLQQRCVCPFHSNMGLLTPFLSFSPFYCMFSYLAEIFTDLNVS